MNGITNQDDTLSPAAASDLKDAAQAVESATDTAVEASWMQTRAVVRVILIVIGVTLAILGSILLLYKLEGVLLLVILATFFAYLIAPLVDFVRRPFKLRSGEYKMPRPVAIGIVYLLLFGSLGVAIYTLSPRLAKQLNQFTQKSETYSGVLEGRVQSLRNLSRRLGLPVAGQDAIANFAPGAIENVKRNAEAALPEIIAYLPWLVLIPILGFFLLKDAEEFRRSVLQMIPRGRLRWRGDEFFQDINSTLAAYIRAQLTACLIIGIICSVGFLIIGLPYWLALGILAAMLEFIPLVGPLVVGITAALVASFASPAQAVLVIVFLVVLRIVHDYVIYPRIIGQGIHLHPLAIVLAILCGEELAGLVGIFLAIPVVAIVSVTYRHMLEHRGSTGLVKDLLKPAEQAVVAPPTTDATPTDTNASPTSPIAQTASPATP